MTEEEKFIEGLYDEAEEEMKQVYDKQKENEEELLKEMALIMLTYTVLEGVMVLSLSQRNKELTRLTQVIKKATKGQAELQEETILKTLTNITGKTFKFYSYNKGLKDVRKIIEANFKGKHFSTRVWENEENVSKYLQSQVKKFLDGKIGVNDIKTNIQKGFETNKYNAKRLVETEVSRCSSNSFDRFCKEVGVEKLRYNATLDSKLCDDCSQYHDKVFNLDKKIDVPRHPLCRCFYTVEDDQSVLDKTDYMANRFVPDFGKVREFELKILSRNEKGEPELKLILTNEKRVSNSNFDMWTDMESTSRNKAVRLYEKKLKNIKGELPDWFEMPRVSIIDFEKNGLPQNAIGGYQREVNTIFMNSKYDTDAKILKYLKSKEGYFASVDSNSPLLHELGHKYHYDLMELIANQKRLSYNNAKEMFDSGIENYILSNSSLPNKFIENQLSGYAADSYTGVDRVNEIIAEYFSVKGNSKTELVQFIEDYIKGVEKP